MPPKPDRALRRLVARIAALAPQDIAAILDALDQRQRLAVEQLLRAYVEDGQRETGPAVETLAPWLAERIRSDGGPMTSTARKALEDCARRIFPAPAAPAPSRSLLGRIVSGAKSL